MHQQEFVTLEELGDRLEGQVHPVILETETEFFSEPQGVGTAFVLEHAGELFLISAQHVLNSQNAKHHDLRILLRNAPISIQFDRRAVFQDESDPDPCSDLVIMRIVESQHEALFAAGLSCVRATDCIESDRMSEVEIFRIIGYPDQNREYDYDENVLSAVIWCVNGVLTDPSVPGLIRVKVVGKRPRKFRGMSGSFVMAEINDEWKFAGMVTLASDTEGLLNFIPAEKIVYYLDQMLLKEMGGMLLSEDA
ncbi:hypothetical protein [Pseudomonas sp. GM80]|uniref:hypothetical protein n=1 Tax=Pseudomonas sp. GM80 TaxID=1144339 RepID=UPI00026F4E43|nr:hypothetical protein [Pseudomonas sp. GM80]EJN34409.1 hypothetical protein PMI37_01269 [Pseudomonas sp. GM80]